MESIKWVWSYVKQYKGWMLLGLTLVTVEALLNMVSPYISGIIVDDVILGGQTHRLFGLVGIMAAAVFLKSMVRYLHTLDFEYVSQDILFKIRINLYKHIQELDFSFYDKTRTGDTMTRMTGDLDAVRHFVAWVIYNSYLNAALLICVMVVLFSINAFFTSMLLIITPFVAVVTMKFSKVVRPAFANVREQFSRLNSVVQENISGNRVVKAFAQEDYEVEKFQKENSGYRDANINASRVWGKYLPLLDALAGSFSAVIIFVGGILVIKGKLTMGELVTFNSLSWALNTPMRMLGNIINDTQRFRAAAVKIIELQDVEPKIKNSGNVVKPEKIKGFVEFKNVGFSYGSEKVLENINFQAKPGQIIAIVGPTGSGKTTIMSLMNRFYDCTEGEILIDGINIKDIDLATLRANIAHAMQDVFLFSDTIEGNVAYGVPQSDMDKITWATKTAGAHDFIESFPEGYDTIIGERGVGLSGGQRQRIALARTLLKDAPILILDDTTSSVDIETEHKIQNALKSLFTNKTTFIIAHRISQVKNADIILVIDKGRIIERGTHKELLAKKGYYYSIYEGQYGAYNEAMDNREVG